MKRLAFIFGWMLLLLGPQWAQAGMSDYCSAPPYVTRSIAPNIVILMDNSQDMLNPAFTGSYSPNGTKDNYTGYFKPAACYKYSSNKFAEELKIVGPPEVSYGASDTCPSTAPFRGNLMNWATTSRYDLLQKVLIGGNTASKQGNAHTLVSSTGAWADKTHSGCIFRVSNGNLTITETSAGACTLIAATPTPIAQDFRPGSLFAWFPAGVKELPERLTEGSRAMLASAAEAWKEFHIVRRAFAAQLTITPASALNGTVGVPYSLVLEADGCKNCTISWSFTPNPPAGFLTTGPTYSNIGNKTNARVTWSGTPGSAGSFPFSVTASATGHTSANESYTIVIDTTPLEITTNGLPDGEVGIPYSFQVLGQGGVTPYTWSATGLPPGLTIDSSTGEISGTPTTSGGYNVTVTLTDANLTSVQKTFSGGNKLTIGAATGLNSKSYTVKVDLIEEPLTDLNGNDIWDLGETYTDNNANGAWDGKQGVFQKFWDENNPRARWGLAKFNSAGDLAMDACVPASPASSFYTRIQNANPVFASPLGKGLYGVINYYGFLSPYGTAFSGCTNSDPIDSVPCRKNFVLVISSGFDVSSGSPAVGPFGATADCTYGDSLVQNACFGFTTDLRSDKDGEQNVYTYVINTMGTTNTSILQDAADKGGGKFYNANDSQQLEDQLILALTDILAQAASGTAVSVLTTSSRGIGSMVQAYFLPSVREEGTRDVTWTGYTQNIWIDPKDNLREDTVNDFNLKLDEDKVMKLYFDESANETKTALFSTDDQGEGPSLSTCTVESVKDFSDVDSLWEAGKELALKAPSTRTLFTSKKVIRGSSTDQSFTESPYPEFTTTMNATLQTALNADLTYTAENIIRYVRGECLETGVTGDTSCGGTPNATYRDRRMDVGGTQKVWKLGDIISSTPKVFANTPLNTYHIDYGDNTYYDYFTSNAYKQKSSIAFVGANDGVLHAFRVGYLKDTGLSAGIKALFKNDFASGDGANNLLGEELWGYIPYHTFPYLKYLANPAYCHIYYNDLSVRLVDVSTNGNPTDTRTSASWKTVLLGGMRYGGGCTGGTPGPAMANVGFSSYYALDITDPMNPVPLWEFSDPDMGFASSFPAILRTGAKAENGRWYVAFGTGSTVMPKSSTDVNRSTAGYIYILDLMSGDLVPKVLLDHTAIVGDVLAIDEEKDYVSEKLYFGTAYESTGWKGKVVSIAIPDQDLTTASLSAQYLFDGVYPFTASPDAARDTDSTVWVYVGSGKYLSDVDEDDASAQLFMGLKHKSSGITYPLADTDLADRTNTTVTGVVTGTAQLCLYDSVADDFNFRTVVTSINPTSTPPSVPTNGWRLMLGTRERVITKPLAVGGLVDFLTYQPDTDLCSYGGDSFLYAVDYTTGVAPTNIAITSPEITGGSTSGTVTVQKGVKLGPGAPPTGEAIIIPPPKEGQDKLKKKIQIATGVIIEAENEPTFSVISKVMHWLKK